jgi:hypothetical protein
LGKTAGHKWTQGDESIEIYLNRASMSGGAPQAAGSQAQAAVFAVRTPF